MVLLTRIELVTALYQSAVLPLNYRSMVVDSGIKPLTSAMSKQRSIIELIDHIGADRGTRTPMHVALVPKTSVSTVPPYPLNILNLYLNLQGQQGLLLDQEQLWP